VDDLLPSLLISLDRCFLTCASFAHCCPSAGPQLEAGDVDYLCTTPQELLNAVENVLLLYDTSRSRGTMAGEAAALMNPEVGGWAVAGGAIGASVCEMLCLWSCNCTPRQVNSKPPASRQPTVPSRLPTTCRPCAGDRAAARAAEADQAAVPVAEQ